MTSLNGDGEVDPRCAGVDLAAPRVPGWAIGAVAQRVGAAQIDLVDTFQVLENLVTPRGFDDASARLGQRGVRPRQATGLVQGLHFVGRQRPVKDSNIVHIAAKEITRGVAIPLLADGPGPARDIAHHSAKGLLPQLFAVLVHGHARRRGGDLFPNGNQVLQAGCLCPGPILFPPDSQFISAPIETKDDEIIAAGRVLAEERLPTIERVIRIDPQRKRKVIANVKVRTLDPVIFAIKVHRLAEPTTEPSPGAVAAGAGARMAVNRVISKASRTILFVQAHQQLCVLHQAAGLVQNPHLLWRQRPVKDGDFVHRAAKEITRIVAIPLLADGPGPARGVAHHGAKVMLPQLLAVLVHGHSRRRGVDLFPNGNQVLPAGCFLPGLIVRPPDMERISALVQAKDDEIVAAVRVLAEERLPIVRVVGIDPERK